MADADATLDAIEQALFDALERLKATAGPFASVARYAEELNRRQKSDARPALALLGKLPGVLLSFETETFTPVVEELLDGNGGHVGRSIWRATVVASDLRGDGTAVKGGETTTGSYALVSLVEAKLGGLRIAGTYRGKLVALLDTKPLTTRRGEYLHVVRVAVERFVDGASPDDDDAAIPLSIAGAVQKRGGFEDAEDAADVLFTPDLTED